MAHTLVTTPVIMSREEYRRWAEAQPRGRFERVGGEVVAMAPERAAHLRVKARAWQALDRAVRAAGVPCEALPDGATVEVDDHTDYEPDAVVNCGAPMADDAVAAPNPVVVVEVLSPSTRSVDTGAKLTDYFRVPSIRHYLVVRADRHAVTHHRRRDDDGGIETRLIAEGRITLDPPGLSILVEELYAL
jgi:Uma2 family endonuclease